MFETLAASPVTRAIGVALLHFIWQGALIALASALAFHALRRAAATSRYVVGCAALLAMAIAPVVTTIRALDQTGPSSAATAVSVDAMPAASELAAKPSSLAANTSAKSTEPAPGAERFLPAIVLAWSLGVFVLTMNLVGAWIRSIRLRRTAFPVGEPWLSQLESAAHRLGVIRRIVLSESVLVDVPTLVGWIRPAIVVPASVLSGLTPSQLDAILTHELAHVRRNDYLVNLFQSAIETLLFYHPAVWWLSGRVRIERELCCDDFVIAVCADRVVYARALASLEELRERRPVLGVAATDGNLLDRVRRILAPAEIEDSRSSAWSVVATAAAIAPLVFFGGGVERSTSAQPAPRADITLAAPERPREIAPVRSRNVMAAPSRQIQAPASPTKDQAAILALEEQFRLAKLERNVQTLDRLLDDAVVSTNQGGVKRNKAELLDLWRTFEVSLLTLDAADVQIAGDLATVTGRQSEISGTGSNPMLFTRIWRRVNGTWRLFSITQFFDPNPGAARRAQVTYTARPVRLEYELYQNDALIGRRTFGFVNTESWSLEIPGEAPIPVTAVAADGLDAVHFNLMGGFPGSPRAALLLEGNVPQETKWTSATKTYRLRIRSLAAESSGAPIVKVGGDVRRPEIVKKVDPIYPPEAKKARVGGMVIVEVLLDEAGNVASAQIVRSVPMLDAAALDAVRQWKYTPTLVNGNPVKVAMSVNVTFAVQ